MNTIERIKYLRKEVLKISQAEFASRINISRANFGSIEIGRIKLTDRVITDICREFVVNPDWLLDGKEPIFKDASDPFADEIVKIYLSLNDDNRKYLRGYMQRLLEEQQHNK